MDMSIIVQAIWDGFKPFLPIYAILTVILLLLITIAKKRKRTAYYKNSSKAYHYQKIPSLLSPNELKFYKFLSPIAANKKLIICPKVRLADLIEPRSGQNWKAAFYKIQAKHIDFVLCEPANLKPLLALELDDSSHDRKDRKERDTFVNSALESAGIPILHTVSTIGLDKKIDDLTRVKVQRTG